MNVWKVPSRALVSFRWIRSRNMSHGSSRYRPIPGQLSYLSVPGAEPLLHFTIGQLVDEAARTHGDSEAVCVLHQNIRKTFAETKKESDELGEGLLSLGLKKGDRVGIWSPNCYEWLLTHHAVAKAGLVLVSLNPAYQAREILYAINRVGISCLVMSSHFKTQDYYEILCSVIPEVRGAEPGKISSASAPTLKSVLSMDKSPPKGTYSFEEIWFRGSKGDGNLVKAASAAIQFDDLFNLQFTSGTTGQPKGVMLSHHNLVNNAFLSTTRLSVTSKDKICLTVPLFHCFGSVAGITYSILRKADLIMPAPSFDPVKAIKAVDSEKCTLLYGTPTMHVDMTNAPELENYDMSSLRTALTAGASIPEQLCVQMKSKYGLEGITSLYGMTETSPVSFQSFPEESDKVLTTVGYPLEHTEVKVVDCNGDIVPVGTEGEMCVRGYLTMLGYWDEPEKTSKVMRSGWLHTGDKMALLPNGYSRVVGRLTDMVIRGGENIYPREIEEFLHTNPKIAEAQVFGVSDERMGEELAVWVRLVAGEEMSASDLKKFCKGQISHFKIPKHIYFRSDFPKTTSGKIQKFKMREIVEAELSSGRSV